MATKDPFGIEQSISRKTGLSVADQVKDAELSETGKFVSPS